MRFFVCFVWVNFLFDLMISSSQVEKLVEFPHCNRYFSRETLSILKMSERSIVFIHPTAGFGATFMSLLTVMISGISNNRGVLYVSENNVYLLPCENGSEFRCYFNDFPLIQNYSSGTFTVDDSIPSHNQRPYVNLLLASDRQHLILNRRAHRTDNGWFFLLQPFLEAPLGGFEECNELAVKSAMLCSVWGFKEDFRKEMDDLRDELQLSSSYIGFHIRRGDKTTTRRSEMAPSTAVEYVEKAIEGIGLIRLREFEFCVVETDDFRSVVELENVLKSFEIPCKVKTLARPSSKGWLMEEEVEKGKEQNFVETREKAVALFAGMELMRDAEFFVCALKSNYANVVYMMRVCAGRMTSSTMSVDGDWDAYSVSQRLLENGQWERRK